MVNTASKNCILFFVKDPIKGQVKRRLAAELDENITVELYRNFILDMLTTLNTCKTGCLICVYPPRAQARFRAWLGSHYHFLPQRGGDLGERMKNGFIEAFRMKCEKAIILGSDIPDLPRAIVTKAFQVLTTHDVTIGPARDGGYYLIGFRNDSFVPEVFDKIRWGESTVLGDTLQTLKKSISRVHLLPAWRDVDTLADLTALLQRNKKHGRYCRETISYLTAKKTGIAEGKSA